MAEETITADARASVQAAALARMRYDGLGYVPPVPPDGVLRDNVVIVGFAGSTRDEAPVLDPSFEVWGMNRLHEITKVQGYTRWFQIHPRYTWDIKEKAKHLQFMATCGMPLYLHKVEPDMPTSIAYPKKAIEQAFNPYLPKLPGSGLIRNDGKPYHATSVTWMIALALMEGFKEIHIYGVDMVCDDEYSYQRPSCEFWLGLAAGLGATMVIPRDSALCTQEWLYGYEMRGDTEGVISTDLVKSRIRGITGERDKMIAAVNQAIGRVQELEQIQNILKHRARGGVTGIKASLSKHGANPMSAPKLPAGAVAKDEPEARDACGVKG